MTALRTALAIALDCFELALVCTGTMGLVAMIVWAMIVWGSP